MSSPGLPGSLQARLVSVQAATVQHRTGKMSRLLISSDTPQDQDQKSSCAAESSARTNAPTELVKQLLLFEQLSHLIRFRCVRGELAAAPGQYISV